MDKYIKYFSFRWIFFALMIMKWFLNSMFSGNNVKLDFFGWENRLGETSPHSDFQL